MSGEAAAPRPPAFRVPLFVQVLSLVLLSLVGAQAINLGILFNLPPPMPDTYRASELALALRGQAVAPRDGPPLRMRRVAQPPPSEYMGRSARETALDLSRRLNVPPEAIRIASDPWRRLGFRLSSRGVHQRLRRLALSRDDHLLLAPFQVALRQADGGWLIAEPTPVFPNPWQQRIALWFVLSSLLLTPAAFLFARRLAAPIAAFAAGAERLGRDPRAPPLAIAGPKEIATAVAAFNGMQERLRSYVEDRTAMVGAVAHDLRTPLTRLRFRIELIPEPLRGKISGDIDQMDAMIAATLAFVRDATQPGARQRLELTSLLESIADEMAETGLDVVTEPGPSVVVEGDPIGLRRLITNLLDNAVKFGERARARVYREAGAAVIEVDDDGPGLPDSECEQVFMPFHRAERSRSRETGGAGLGLAVVRSVARAHGGDASLFNLPPGGMRARAFVPLQFEGVA